MSGEAVKIETLMNSKIAIEDSKQRRRWKINRASEDEVREAQKRTRRMKGGEEKEGKRNSEDESDGRAKQRKMGWLRGRGGERGKEEE